MDRTRGSAQASQYCREDFARAFMLSVNRPGNPIESFYLTDSRPIQVDQHSGYPSIVNLAAGLPHSSALFQDPPKRRAALQTEILHPLSVPSLNIPRVASRPFLGRPRGVFLIPPYFWAVWLSHSEKLLSIHNTPR